MFFTHNLKLQDFYIFYFFLVILIGYHLIAEANMLARTGALAMDYFYLMELPADLNSEQLSEISTDLEYR